MCHPPTKMLSSIISALFRKLYEEVMSPIAATLSCMDSGSPSAPTYI